MVEFVHIQVVITFQLTRYARGRHVATNISVKNGSDKDWRHQAIIGTNEQMLNRDYDAHPFRDHKQ